MNQTEHSRDMLQEHLPSYLINIHPGGRSIYLILLLLILSILVSLPLVSVQVSVSGKGIIRPIHEKTKIISASSGIVSKVFIKEGETIQKSDPLLQVRSVEIQKNLMTRIAELKEVELHVQDLAKLTADPIKMPESDEYQREHEEYLQQIDYLVLIRSKAKKELARHEGLFRSGLISAKEYDDLVFSLEKSNKELDNYISQSLSRWQNEYYRLLAGMRELNIKISNAEEKIRLTTITAPATGNMVDFNGIFEGSAVQAGTVLGILSPESGLIGEFFVSSQNIAFMDIGQKVHIHLDAFSSREWGFVSGDIYEISSDFIIMENQPVYRIKCRLDHTVLSLKNGYSSNIRKGMTFQARCLLRRRTLFQLLADKAENWLNPAF